MDGFFGPSGEYWGIIITMLGIGYVVYDKLNRISIQLCILIKTLRNEDPSDC